MNRLTLMGAGGNAGAASFSPSDIASLVAWWDANTTVYKDAGSTLASVGDSVQQWNDRKNSSNFSQGTLGNRPTLQQRSSKNVIRFDGTDDFMTATDNANLDLGNVLSIFLVGTVGGTFADYTFLSKGVNAYQVKQGGSGKLLLNKQGTGTVRNNNTNLSANTFYKFTCRRDASTRTVWRDGADDSGGVDNNFATADTATDLYIGQLSGGGESLNGEIRALLLFNAYITDADIANLEAYYP